MQAEHFYYLLVKISSKIKNQILETVYSYHVTYAFQSESTLYSCLNITKIIAVDTIFHIDFFEIRFTHTRDHQARNFLTNELHHK